jgi:hypothetical protein
VMTDEDPTPTLPYVQEDDSDATTTPIG